MAWIKMTHELWTSPEVVRIVSALKADKLRTVGALYVLWCVADMHAEHLDNGDGLLAGYTLEAVDEAVGWVGFGAAMVGVGWVKVTEKGLVFPHFSRHNGASAKRRAADAERKNRVRKMSASEADKKRTRGEEIREDEIREENHTQNQESAGCVRFDHHAPKIGGDGSNLTPQERWQPFFMRRVLVALPKRCQVNPRQFWRACGEALDRIQSGADVTPAKGKTAEECIDWLVDRARAYAASDLGKTQYAIMGYRWLDDSRYLDPPEAWSRSGNDGRPTLDDKIKALAKESEERLAQRGKPD